MALSTLSEHHTNCQNYFLVLDNFLTLLSYLELLVLLSQCLATKQLYSSVVP